MKYTIKLLLEFDDVIDEQWAIGSILHLDASDKEKALVRRELLKSANIKTEELLNDS